MTSSLKIDDETQSVLAEMRWTDDITSEMTFAFLIQVSSLEFKILEKGFRRPRRRPWGCWEKFGEKFSLEFPARALDISRAHRDFLLDPPGELVETSPGQLTWALPEDTKTNLERRKESEITPDDFVELCRLVYQVRNNLFHGNKMIDNELATASRLQETLEVVRDLRHAIKMFPERRKS